MTWTNLAASVAAHKRMDGIAVYTWLGTVPDAYGHWETLADAYSRRVRCWTLNAYYVVRRWPACGTLGNRRVLATDSILTTVQYSCKCGKGNAADWGQLFGMQR